MSKQKNKSNRNYGDMPSYANSKEELIKARREEVQRDILPGFFTKFMGEKISSISAKERASRMSKYV